ncbi:MAG: aldehyde dehydrogenase family protein, partial [Elusimicrobia bacterium]|nr:aldehyde dehydrogenase family protein [Elusimicrobiota bacterium]
TLERVASASEALAAVAAGKWGLQAGVFTRDVETVLSAWDRVPVGGLVVNDVPSYRSDVMPYGGTKLSGLGREGVRWAMEELTEPRVLVLSRPG